jgi:4-amino-4-deoxy-L-arabinose transferase-like glycosyltransferase
MVLFVIGAGLVVIPIEAPHGRSAMAGFACIVTALLLAPAIWSGLTVMNASANQSPGAYSQRSAGRSGPGTAQSGQAAGLQINQELLDYLEPRTREIDYLMAVPSSMQGADYVIATGRPVLYMGGFKGDDAVVSDADLAQLVAAGRLRYIYWGQGIGRQKGTSAWVTAHCTIVPGFEPAGRNFGSPDGDSDAYSSAPPPGQQQGEKAVTLYDCGG